MFGSAGFVPRSIFCAATDRWSEASNLSGGPASTSVGHVRGGRDLTIARFITLQLHYLERSQSGVQTLAAEVMDRPLRLEVLFRAQAFDILRYSVKCEREMAFGCLRSIPSIGTSPGSPDS